MKIIKRLQKEAAILDRAAEAGINEIQLLERKIEEMKQEIIQLDIAVCTARKQAHKHHKAAEFLEG